MEQKYRLKNLTPPEMCTAIACPTVYELEEIASVDCTAIACPTVYQPKEISSEDCGVGSCAGVYEGEPGKEVYIIIGKQLNPEEVGLAHKVGEGETLIEIPKGLLASLQK